jgi:hypothetical protein
MISIPVLKIVIRFGIEKDGSQPSFSRTVINANQLLSETASRPSFEYFCIEYSETISLTLQSTGMLWICFWFVHIEHAT